MNFHYHGAFNRDVGLAYAGLFALTPQELSKDATAEPFDALQYIANMAEELGPNGTFRRMEARISGDPEFNNALPGQPGGVYDNFGYDRSEEAHSVLLLAQWRHLTGEGLFVDFTHDRYRGVIYQAMGVPYTRRDYTADEWCRAAGTWRYQVPRIFYAQHDTTQPNDTFDALTAAMYQSPATQFFVDYGAQHALCGGANTGLIWDLIYHDASLTPTLPEASPTASYFSGPGLVSMRSDWTADATYALFLAGEGISRRYEDANSFIIHRKQRLFPHAGGRIRNNPDNHKHHWYHVHSIAKNTLRVIDPAETFTIDDLGKRGALHTGTPLMPSDNLGGQLFEVGVSNTDLDFTLSGAGRTAPAHPLSSEIYETANVVRYAHVPDSYTYTAGVGTWAYSAKVSLFEREFVFLRPGQIVVFDRVTSADPAFKKVWVLHSVDRPELDGAADNTGQGWTRRTDTRTITVNGPETTVHLTALLPEANVVEVRGGQTALYQGPLTPAAPVAMGQVTESELPRWLELVAGGTDVEGSMTLSGVTMAGEATQETLTLDHDKPRVLHVGTPGGLTGTTLSDPTATWTMDQWAGAWVELHGGGGAKVHITGNSATELFGAFPDLSPWRYTVYRPLANTTLHWQQVDSITTTDLDLSDLTLSATHHFDVVDASGRLHDFSPHTDAEDDLYRGDSSIGRWTLNIETTTQEAAHHFLNVIDLGDPGFTPATVTKVESALVAGALVGTRLVVFAKAAGTVGGFTVSVDGPVTEALVFNLTPGAAYDVVLDGGSLTLVEGGGAGTPVASDQGVVRWVQ